MAQLGDWQVSHTNADRATVATGSAADNCGYDSRQNLVQIKSDTFRGVAQLVAREVWDFDAAGSSPVTPTKIQFQPQGWGWIFIFGLQGSDLIRREALRKQFGELFLASGARRVLLQRNGRRADSMRSRRSSPVTPTKKALLTRSAFFQSKYVTAKVVLFSGYAPISI